MLDLAHLTANTGDLRMSPRAEVADDIIALLRSIVDAWGGQISGGTLSLPWWLHLVDRDPWGASWYLTLGEHGPHIIEAQQCWDPLYSYQSWRQAIAQRRLIQAPPIDEEPAPTPWLVVWFGPALAQLPREQVGMLGDFERCLAWALIEASRAQS